MCVCVWSWCRHAHASAYLLCVGVQRMFTTCALRQMSHSPPTVPPLPPDDPHVMPEKSLFTAYCSCNRTIRPPRGGLLFKRHKPSVTTKRAGKLAFRRASVPQGKWVGIPGTHERMLIRGNTHNFRSLVLDPGDDQAHALAADAGFRARGGGVNCVRELLLLTPATQPTNMKTYTQNRFPTSLQRAHLRHRKQSCKPTHPA